MSSVDVSANISNMYYLDTAGLVAGGNTIGGTSLNNTQLSAQGNYTGFSFAGAGTQWQMPAGFSLPDGGSYSYAVHNWLTTANHGFVSAATYGDDPQNEDLASIFDSSSDVVSQFDWDAYDIIASTDPVTTVTPGNLEISVLAPVASGESFSTTKLVHGECGQAGNIIKVTGSFDLWTVCQSNNRWAILLDAVGLSTGTITTNYQLRSADDSSGSTVVTRTFNKTSVLCSDPTALQGEFANSHLGANGTTIPYAICTPGQFGNIAFHADKSFSLENDINFAGNTFSPITSTFSGTINGKGYKISNYIISKPSTSYTGLFQLVNGATIQNLTLEGFTVSGYQYVGALAGQWGGSGIINNVTVNGSVTGVEYTGGLIGLANNSSALDIDNYLSNSIISGNNHTGGVIGFINSTGGSLNADNITLNNTLTGLANVGGFAGQSLESNVTIVNMNNSGSITSYKENTGGLFGYLEGGNINGCSLTASINAGLKAADGNVGGAIGQVPGSLILNNCSYNGTITAGSNNVGGLIGKLHDGTLSNLTSTGQLTHNEDKYNSVSWYIGGLVGLIEETTSMTVSSSSMNINSTARYVGGLVGRFSGENSILRNSSASGSIAAKTDFVGGLAGFFWGAELDDSHATGNITVTDTTPDSYIGGLLGYANNVNSEYDNLYSTGNVTVSSGLADYVGGLIGYFRGGNLRNSYATGNVTGVRNMSGGLVGLMRGNLLRSYATGNVTSGGLFNGGLVGYLYESNLNDSFATGDVEANSKSGGLVGYINTTAANTVQHNYYSGSVSRASGSVEPLIEFGPLLSEELNAGSFDTTTNFYIAENANGSHNTIGSSMTLALADNQSTYTSFSFGGSTDWRMPSVSYQLPGSGVDYLFPVLDWQDSGASGPPPSFTVGGTLAGLQYDQISITLNGSAETLNLTPGTTSFTFATTVAEGSPYSVAITAYPTGPSLICTLSNGSGTMGAGNVTNVSVVCPTINSIALTPGAMDIPLGTSQQLTVTGTLSTGGTVSMASSVSFTHSPGGIFSISGSGMMTADAIGSSTITANFLALSSGVAYDSVDAPEPATLLGWAETTPHSNLTLHPTWTKSIAGDLSTQRIDYYTVGTCSGAPISSAILSTVVTSHTFNGTDGQTYYFSILSTDTDGYFTKSSCSPAMQIDINAPDPVTSPAIAAAWISGAGPHTSPLVTWNNPASLDHVEISLGTSYGNADTVAWTDVGSSTSHTFSGLAGLTECTPYYPSMKVLNVLSQESPIATATLGFRVDNTAPSAISSSITLSGEANENSAPTTTHTPATDNCTVRFYEMAIGTTAGATDISGGWRNIGQNVVYTASTGLHGFNLSLSPGTDYYTTVRAVDYGDNRGPETSSAAWQLTTINDDMFVWMDASDRSTVKDNSGNPADNPSFNGNVSTFEDNSGSATVHNFTAASAPAYQEAELAIDLDGLSQFFTASSSAEIDNAIFTDRNVTLSFKTGAEVTSTQILYEQGNATRGLNVYIYDDKLYCGFWNETNDGDGAQPFTYVSSDIGTNSVYHVSLIYDYTNYAGAGGADGSVECFINKNSIGSVPTTSRLYAHSGGIGLGAMVSGTRFHYASASGTNHYFSGDLLEIRMENTLPNAAKVSDVHEHLMDKWSAAVLNAPVNLTIINDSKTNESATGIWEPVPSPYFILDHYEVAIGTTAGGNEVVDWSSTGSTPSWQAIDGVTATIALSYDVDYYFSVKAIDTADNESLIISSAAWQVFNPAEDLPDMIAWLDGTDLTSIEDSAGRNATNPSFSGTVENWRDISGSAVTHDFNIVSGTRPAFSTGTGIMTWGGASYATTPNHSEINTSTVLERNVTVAFKTSNDISTTQVLYEEGGATRGMNVYIDSGNLYCGFWNDTNDGDGIEAFKSVSSSIEQDEVYFVTWVYDYTHYTTATGPEGYLNCYVNNTLIGSETTTSRLFGHSASVGLGGKYGTTKLHTGDSSGNGFGFNGELYEFMLFNEPPTLADIGTIHTFLSDKWAPAPTSDPANLAMNNNSGATSSATGSWDAPDPLYFALDHYEIAIGSTKGANDILTWTNIGTITNYQAVNGVDGVSLALTGDTNYFYSIKAVDTSFVDSAVLESDAWSFTAMTSCLDHYNAGSTTDGVYTIDVDGAGPETPVSVYCDQTTQGGGWTLVVKYDADKATTANYALHANAMRSNVNVSELTSMNAGTVMSASINAIPLIAGGATMIMHVSKDDATSVYSHLYFSEIYQTVLDTPSKLFDSSLDTDAAEPVSGSVANFNATLKNQWFDNTMTLLSDNDLQGAARDFRINGGEGEAMWTNGSREGALYSSHSNSSLVGHSSPNVQWGFRGKDGSQQSYGASVQPEVGTHMKNNLAEGPQKQLNFMFVK